MIPRTGATSLRLAVAMFATASGCHDEPALAFRWRIAERLTPEQAAQQAAACAADPDRDDCCPERVAAGHRCPPLLSSRQCTLVGIDELQFSAIGELGLTADARRFPCFPRAFEDDGGVVGSGTMAPGPYLLRAIGLRSDGTSWEGTGEELDYAVDEQHAEPDGEHTLAIDDFVLTPPPPCVDGVDNDRDGAVDLFDPGCRVSDREEATSPQTRVRVKVSFFDRHPVLNDGGVRGECSVVGVHLLRFDLDGVEVARDTCVPGRTYELVQELAAGGHTFDVVGLGRTEDDWIPVTVAEHFEFDVPEDRGVLVELAADFSDADFLEPIVAGTILSVDFGPSPTPGSICRRGDLVVDGLRVRLLDAHGRELAAPLSTVDGTPLDGGVVPCSERIELAPVQWGGYLAAIDAEVGGTVCYSNADAPVALLPGTSWIELPRVDPVPDACRVECTDSCIQNGGDRCVDRLCEP